MYYSLFPSHPLFPLFSSLIWFIYLAEADQELSKSPEHVEGGAVSGAAKKGLAGHSSQILATCMFLFAFYILFYFILLYYIVLYCIVLYCIVLYCIVLYFIYYISNFIYLPCYLESRVDMPSTHAPQLRPASPSVISRLFQYPAPPRACLCLDLSQEHLTSSPGTN